LSETYEAHRAHTHSQSHQRPPHRRWVNNCIGRSNYRPFLGMVTSVNLMVLLQLAAGGYLLAHSGTDPQGMQAELDAAYPLHVDVWGYVAALSLYSAALLVVLYYLGELWLLHAALLAKGITTWEYIQLNRQPTRRLSGALPTQSSLGDRVRYACGLRSSRVHDATAAMATAPRLSHTRVPLDPCLALRTKVGSRHEPLAPRLSIGPYGSGHKLLTGKSEAAVPPIAGFDAAGAVAVVGLEGSQHSTPRREAHQVSAVLTTACVGCGAWQCTVNTW